MVRALLAVCVIASIGCGSSQPEASEPVEPGAATETETPATTDGVEGSEHALEQTPTEGDAPRGRMAFTQCTDPRAEMCTKEYRPVCGVVDTGVRCVTTPCDSTEQRNFGNACMACAEAKTTGYWPVPCEELNSDAH